MGDSSEFKKFVCHRDGWACKQMQSHVEEEAGRETFIPFAMVKLCCETHTTAH